MVFYEMMLLLRPDLGQEDIDAALERVQEILRQQDGELAQMDVWGKRRLAYEIEDYREGHYTLFHYEATPEAVRELERLLKLDERVLRYLVVRAEKPEFEPPSEEEEDEAGDTPVAEEETTVGPTAAAAAAEASEPAETMETMETEAESNAEAPALDPEAPWEPEIPADSPGQAASAEQPHAEPESVTPQAPAAAAEPDIESGSPDQAASAEQPHAEPESVTPQAPAVAVEPDIESGSPDQAAAEGPEPQDPDKVG